MRSKFIVRVSSKGDKKFPSDDELRSVLRTFGWEWRDASVAQTDEEKLGKYKELGSKLLDEMPEVAKHEINDVIYAGYLSAEMTYFVVTRSSEGEMTFRLLQPELQKLIQATERVIRAIERQQITSRSRDNIVNNVILVYEKGFDHVILHGRVVEHKLLETFKSNLKDTVVVMITLFVLVVIMAVFSIDLLTGKRTEWIDSGLRLSISVAALFLASLAGLIITYRDIKASRLVNWNLKRPEF